MQTQISALDIKANLSTLHLILLTPFGCQFSPSRMTVGWRNTWGMLTLMRLSSRCLLGIHSICIILLPRQEQAFRSRASTGNQPCKV